MNLSRKDFLFNGLLSLSGALFNPSGYLDDAPGELCDLRPPGFQPERAAACAGCEACVNGCPEGVLVGRIGVEGPVFDPALGSCTFCGQCLAACTHGVLQPAGNGNMARIGIARADNSLCLAQRGGCFTCLERCPEEAIAIEPGEGIRIDTGRCKGCGACEYGCPLVAGAIKVVPAP